jgi:hypothetical protein
MTPPRARRPSQRLARPACLGLTLAVAAVSGCNKKDAGGVGASGSTSASPPSASAAVKASTGPTVTIPAGALRAGTVCAGVPRITTEELVGESIALSEFQIDVFPYPNDPTKPARVNVSRDEAAGLCAAEGKRLCTELEWERACKGPSNTTFEYGAAYNQGNCKSEVDLLPDKRPKCVSGFGVKDMHGLAFEWTQSAWGRGTSGDLGTVRGGQGPAGLLQARCANGQSRPATTQAADVGFRCCSGPVNAAAVNLELDRQPPMVEEPAVEATLAAAMLRTLPPDHRAVPDADVAFDKVWRWHPRDNEELLVARWRAKPKAREKRTAYEAAIFKVCGKVPALVARMRGPVSSLGNPGAGADPQQVSFQVAIDADKGDVRLHYVYGAVQVDQPVWIKLGNQLPDAPTTVKLRLPLKLPKRR